MSSNNDNGEMFGFAVVIAMIGFMVFLLYAVLSFIAIILTVIALLAWNNPLRLGNMTVEPADARAFVGRGIAGAIVLPLFVGFCELLFDLRIEWDAYIGHMLLGGYTLGSVVLEMMAEEATPQASAPEYLPPVPRLPVPPQRTPSVPEQQPFRFASWNDEADERAGQDSPCRGCAYYDGGEPRLLL